MRFGRLAPRLALGLILLVGADQLLANTVLRDGLFMGRPVAPFDPPLFSTSQRGALARVVEELESDRPSTRRFDAELGWCNQPNSGFGEFRYDWAGARIGAAPLERVKRDGVVRIVAVGCSMTHGEEVGAEEAWCARVDAAREDVEVANLGVAAYGIDQALLRLRRDGWKLAPDEVWLGILPQAALRVTTFFRPLLDHWSLDVAFKPRFALDADGRLQFLPNPAQSLTDVRRLLDDQSAFLAACAGDPWLEHATLAYAPRGSSWTHRSFAARLFLTVQERTARDVDVCFDERTGFGALYSEIVRTFQRECTARGIRFRVLFLPGKDDLRTPDPVWRRWSRALGAEGVQFVDLAPVLEGAADPARLFAPGGHYSAEASALVARALVDELVTNHALVPALSGAEPRR